MTLTAKCILAYHSFKLIDSEKERTRAKDEVKELRGKIEQIQLEMKKLYDFEKFETDYLSGVVKLF